MKQEKTYLMLVIDEDPKVRKGIIHSLPNLQIRSMETDNGMDAMEILENHTIDFIVSNVRMGKMDGIQFIDVSRRNYQEIPLIAVVEADRSEQIIEAFRAGAFDVLTELRKADELQEIVLSLIDEIEKKRNRTFEFKTIRYFTEELNLKNDIGLVSVTVDHLVNYIKQTHFSDKVPGLKVALYEMIVNAIEHGNLAISDKDKEQALGENRFRELVESRRIDPQFKNRLVRISLNYNPVQLTIAIQDEGEGFDINSHTDPSRLNPLAHSGRGILMTKLYCDELRYNKSGNRATIVLKSNASEMGNIVQKSSATDVLLVEHDEESQVKISELLIKTGYSCTIVKKAPDLKKLLEEETFDLILLSSDIPPMGGLSVLEELKNHIINRRIPVIMLVCDRNEKFMAECFSKGAEDIFEKPINQSIFKPRIESTLMKVHSVRQIGMANEKLQLLNDQLTEQNKVLSLTQKELEGKQEQIENDLLLAEKIQTAIFSKTYSSESLQSTVCFKPYNIVSGDIYYFGEDSHGGVNIFLGDATGHGVSAAFLTMLVRMALGMTDPDLPPAQIIREINTQLSSCVPRGDYMTGALIKVDVQGAVIGCNAGGAACFVQRKTGEVVEFFSGGGMPLGMFGDERVTYVDETVQLKNGDRIILLTDGVLERRNRYKEVFGSLKAQESIKNSSNLTLLQQLKKLEKDVSDFSGMTAEDDYTILSIEYLGTPKESADLFKPESY